MIDNLNIYVERRKRLFNTMRSLSPNSVAYLATAPEVMRNRDSDYPYRYDSYFYYLTGFHEPESSIALIVGDRPEQDQTILFCREKNSEREIWDGIRYGTNAARVAFGMDLAYPTSLLDEKLPELLANRSTFFTALAHTTKSDMQQQRWLKKVRAQARTGQQAPAHLHDIYALLDEMRLVKDTHEIATMRRAAHISAQGHRTAMQTCRAGLREYHLEATLLHAFRYAGAESVAYNSIVAAGENTCVLHYRAGNRELRAGELCLIDAGCELQGYASDITRTFPVSGKFTPPQRTLYEIVLAAQEAAIAVTRPGQHFMQAHHAAVAVLAQGMLDTKLLDHNIVGNLNDVIEKQAYAKFYMHRTGHWLGLDVHDCGAYQEPGTPPVFTPYPAATSTASEPSAWRILKPGMVCTIEPGLYVRPDPTVPECYWHIGIRIEDDAVVTPQGCELISRDVPVQVNEIEALMAHG
ncbi:MAG: aminopeptidase P N-terminal domain-containing protein [Ottowia sp.]|nr:aminopeptidase P N-terminal domain-containing protein [Ottowia sp.]